MDLSILNPQQRSAVTAPMGPVLILAGAGSGKTRVLTYRIAHLIESGLVVPQHILALTFTNKAAKEMQTRVMSLLTKKANSYKLEPRTYKLAPITSPPTMGTFHSVCARLLRREISKLGYTPNFSIYDTEDQLKVIREACDELDIDKKFPPSMFRSYISAAKNIVQSPAEFNIGLSPYLANLVQQVYIKYQNALHRQNAVDFDDLLLLVIKLLEAYPDVRDRYQKLFSYILVDEYQDTNQAQYRLLSLLITNGNIFVVGDDAQSIYRFRGSSIANILNFEKDYPDSLVITLAQNYRSTKHILHAADSVIKLNQNQKPKKLWTDNPSGNKVVMHEAEDEYAEARFVAEKIISLATGNDQSDSENVYEEPEEKSFSILDHYLKKSRVKGLNGGLAGSVRVLPANHEPLTNYAVLYRTHAQSRAIEDVFVRAGIPYKIVGGVRFYERKEVKDVLAYLKLVVNIFDLVSLKRVLNEPARGLGDKSYTAIKQLIESIPIPEDGNRLMHDVVIAGLPSCGLSSKQQSSAKKFFDLLSAAAAAPQDLVISKLMHLLATKSGLMENLDDGTEVGQVRKDNVNELLSVATKFDNVPWQEGIQNFLEEVALVTDAEKIGEQQDVVTLMTLHSAKGLEYDTVFFVGLEEGVLPHSRSLMDPEELAEEIRLAYVGMTRAQKRLYLLYAKQRMVFGGLKVGVPSRILNALPDGSVTGSIKHKTNHRSYNAPGELSYEEIDF